MCPPFFMIMHEKLNCGIQNSSLYNKTKKCTCIKYVLSHIINDLHDTVTQSAQKGRYMNVLENYFIQLFQHNNMIKKNKYWKKDKFFNWFMTYRCHACTYKHPKHCASYSLPMLYPSLKGSPLWYTPLWSKKVCKYINNCFTEHAVFYICCW